MPPWAEFPMVVLVTTLLWVLATFFTAPESQSVLRAFYNKIQPGGPGWKKVVEQALTEGETLVDDKQGWSVPSGLLAMLLGCNLIYSCMFATGYYIYGKLQWAIILTGVAIVSGVLLIKVWKKIRVTIL